LKNIRSKIKIDKKEDYNEEDDDDE